MDAMTGMNWGELGCQHAGQGAAWRVLFISLFMHVLACSPTGVPGGECPEGTVYSADEAACLDPRAEGNVDDELPDDVCYLDECAELAGDPPDLDVGTGAGATAPCLVSPTGTYPPVQTQAWHLREAYDVAGEFVTAMANGVVRDEVGRLGSWDCYEAAICYGSESCPCVSQPDGSHRVECGEDVANPVYGSPGNYGGLACYNEACSSATPCEDTDSACHNQVTLEFRGSDGNLYRQRVLHTAELLVAAGSTVTAGARIARIGNTGFSCTGSPTGTGNHGHVSVYRWDPNTEVWSAQRWWAWMEASCTDAPSPCAGLPDGAYCATNGPFNYEGDADDLLQCRNGQVVQAQPCQAGCIGNQAGTNDACNASTCPGDGTCSSHGACANGSCTCFSGFGGSECHTCAPGYSGYPACTPTTTCTPSWTCSWSACASGTELASNCVDAAGCGTTVGQPTERDCPRRIRVRRRYGSNGQGCGNPTADWDHCPSFDGTNCIAGQGAMLNYVADPGPDFWVFPLGVFGSGNPDTVTWEYSLVRLDACYHAATTRHVLEPTDRLKVIGVESNTAGANGVNGWSCAMVGYVRTGSTITADPHMVPIFRNESTGTSTSFYQTVNGADASCGISGAVGWYAWDAE